MSDLIPATADELLAKIDQAAEVRRQQTLHELQELHELVRRESRDWVTAGLLCLTVLGVVAFWVVVVLLLVSL